MNGEMLRGFVVGVTVIFYCRTLRRQEGGEALVRVAHWMADKTELQGGLSRDANRPRSEVELMLLKNVLISISVEINVLLGNPSCIYLALRI